MDIQQAVTEYEYATAGLTSMTKRWYTYKLKYFLSWCERYNYTLEDLTPARIRRYLQFLRSEYKQANGKQLSDYTIHGYAQVVKGFLSWCSQEEGLDQYVSEKAVARIELPKVEKKLIPTFTPDEIERLFMACTKEPTPQLVVRNRAIVAVLLDTGARVSELFVDPARSEREHTGLLLENVYLAEKDAYIKVTGKGRKEREIALGAKSRLYLHRYITRYRGRSTSSYAFLSRTGEPLTARGAQQVIYRLAERAGVDDCHPHRFRHTFAVNYLRAGGDLYALSRLLGHTSVNVTEVYLRSYQSEQMRQGKRISVVSEMTRNDK